MDGWHDSTTKLEALHRKPHFLISLPSLLMGFNYPTDYVAINQGYGTFLTSIYIGSQTNEKINYHHLYRSHFIKYQNLPLSLHSY